MLHNTELNEPQDIFSSFADLFSSVYNQSDFADTDILLLFKQQQLVS